MKLHEYQAKEVFADAGIPTPASELAETVGEAVDAAESVGCPVAVKAQVQVGGRGKAGGIELVEDAEEAREAAGRIIGMDLKGLHVEDVLVEFHGRGGVSFDRARQSSTGTAPPRLAYGL